MASGRLYALLVLATGLPSCWADGYTPPFGCPRPLGDIDDALREEVLTMHNKLRHKVAHGQEKAKNSFLPQAQNMYDLMWNCTLEQMAEQIVVNCPPKAKPPGPAFNSKQWPAQKKANLKGIVKSWGDKVTQVDPWPQWNIYDKALKIKPYANMINGKTTAVGCSQVNCGDPANPTGAAAACVYDQPQLQDGDTIYESGQPCDSTTPSPGPCSTYSPSTCVNGLCRKDITTTTTTTMATTIDPANTMCPLNPAMNDKTRNKALDMHNYRRSILAQGQVQKNTGLLLPKGANIIKLKYDCQMEYQAQAESHKCIGSSTTDFNAYKGSPPAAGTRILAMEEAVKSWWSQVRKVDGPGEKVTFKQHHVNAPIRTFTRMAWATTEKLGCGVTRCHPDYVVVCFYRPRGNIVDSVIYKVGNPCTSCPTGNQCDNSLCVV